jgi:phosphoribosylanthranilate isomerase
MVTKEQNLSSFGLPAFENYLEKVRQLQLQYIQMHGGESVQECAALKENNIKVIKVFSVDDGFNFEQTRPYKTVADFFLFDTRGKYHGGNAFAFDWRVLQQYDQEVPFFLSGGIGVDNIQLVSELQQMNLHAVDVNSGVEISAALKDIDKIKIIKQFLNSKSLKS